MPPLELLVLQARQRGRSHSVLLRESYSTLSKSCRRAWWSVTQRYVVAAQRLLLSFIAELNHMRLCVNESLEIAQVRLLLLAAMASEHVLLIGPPGTAKSEVGRRLSKLISGTYFERLLTRFSVPEVCVFVARQSVHKVLELECARQ
jgi:hypothetical protein